MQVDNYQVNSSVNIRPMWLRRAKPDLEQVIKVCGSCDHPFQVKPSMDATICVNCEEKRMKSAHEAALPGLDEWELTVAWWGKETIFPEAFEKDVAIGCKKCPGCNTHRWSSFFISYGKIEILCKLCNH